MKPPGNSLVIPHLADEMEKAEMALILDLYRSLSKTDQTSMLRILIESSLAPDASEVREGVLAHVGQEE